MILPPGIYSVLSVYAAVFSKMLFFQVAVQTKHLSSFVITERSYLASFHFPRMSSGREAAKLWSAANRGSKLLCVSFPDVEVFKYD